MRREPIPRQVVMPAVSNFLFCALIIGSVALVWFINAISRSEGSSGTVVSPFVSAGVCVFFLLALVNGIGYLFRSVFFGYLLGNVFAVALLL